MKTDLLPRVYSKEEANLLSPLQLAYIGDSVHALLIRGVLMGRDLPVKAMHRLSTAAVNAVSQCRAASRLLPLLTEEEAAMYRRGRNAHAHHAGPRSASTTEYAAATGLETLLGFLYLTGQLDRLSELTPYLCPEEEDANA